MRGRDALLLALIVVAGAALRVALLREGFWRDEASTYYDIAAHGLDGTLRMIARIELAPPAYFLIEKAWAHVAGLGDVALKLPSFLYGLGLIAAVYALGRVAVGSAVGLLAALCAAVSQPAIALSAEARVYAFAALAAALTLLAYLRALQRPSTSAIVWFVVFGTVLIYANYAGSILLALLAATTAFTLMRSPDRGRLHAFIASFAAIALLYVPWIPTMLMHASIGVPFQESTRPDTLANIINNDFGNLLPVASRHGQVGLAFVAGALVWLGSLLVPRLRGGVAPTFQRAGLSKGTPEDSGILAFCAIAGACICALLSLREPRYVFVFAPAAWVWFAWLTARLWQWLKIARRWQQIAVALVCIVVVALFVPSERKARAGMSETSSGIRTFAPAAVALERSNRTLFLAVPDYLAPTFGYYVSRPSGAEIHGFARWQEPQIFVTRGYRDVWTNPSAVVDVEHRITVAMQTDERLVVIRDAILIDRARMPYTRSNALLAWLHEHYRVVSSREYPGAEEDVIVDIYMRSL